MMTAANPEVTLHINSKFSSPFGRQLRSVFLWIKQGKHQSNLELLLQNGKIEVTGLLCSSVEVRGHSMRYNNATRGQCNNLAATISPISLKYSIGLNIKILKAMEATYDHFLRSMDISDDK